MSIETALQTAIFNKISGAVIVSGTAVPVYDNVPQPSAFPYITVGHDTHVAWDTDTSVGFESTVTIHTWSRYNGMSETKLMQGQLYDLLHRYQLSVTGFVLVDVEFDYAESMLDPDGQTRHGVVRFRIITDELIT